MVGNLEKPSCECGAGTTRSRLASSDTVNKTIEIPRSRKTTLILHRIVSGSFNLVSDRLAQSYVAELLVPVSQGIGVAISALSCQLTVLV